MDANFQDIPKQQLLHNISAFPSDMTDAKYGKVSPVPLKGQIQNGGQGAVCSRVFFIFESYCKGDGENIV